MGCTSSSAVQEAPPEPLPTFAKLSEISIVHRSEPHIYSDASLNYISPNKPLSLILRKIGSGNKGDAFQLETLNDELFHDLQIHPSKSGVANIRGRIEDLVHLHMEGQPNAPLCYAAKNASKGLNHYALLRTEPLYKGQEPSPIKSPHGDMYTYAAIEFDIKQKVGKVTTIFRSQEEKDLAAAQKESRMPMFTLHQCNPNVWVVKRLGIVSAAFNMWKGMAKLSCWRVAVCKGEDPILMMMLVQCIDSFLPVAKSQFWKFTDTTLAQDIDFPALPEGMDEKLFGKKCRFW
jgi:hypothetical protein